MQKSARVEVVVRDPPDCPVAEKSSETGADARSVSRTRTDPVTEEAVLEGADEGGTFSYGSSEVFRFRRDADGACACELVEGHGTPIADARVRDGDLYLVFHADRKELRQILDDLRGRYDKVEVRRVVSENDADESRGVLGTDEMTERQREALETAHRMGYFDHPKGANAGDVADEMGIATSTFTEHLSAAQRKLMDAVLNEETDLV